MLQHRVGTGRRAVRGVEWQPMEEEVRVEGGMDGSWADCGPGQEGACRRGLVNVA